MKMGMLFFASNNTGAPPSTYVRLHGRPLYQITFKNYMNLTHFLAKPFIGAVMAAALVAGPAALAHDTSKHDVEKVKPAGTTLTVQINAGNRVLVRGATVTAVSGQTLTVTTAFGSTTLTWVVNAKNSQLIDRDGNEGNHVATTTPVAVGDVVNFSGALDPSKATLTVNAAVVRDLSQKVVQKNHK